jgi:predicted metal-dependent hydrolase
MFFRRIVIRRRIIHPDKTRITFTHGQNVSVMGKQFTIVVQDSNSTSSTARCKDGVVKVRLAADLDGRSRNKHISLLSRRAISRAMLPLVEEKMKQFNERHFNSELGAVRLKDNLSNWGSCSSRNNINIDFRLLFGPTEILEAVMLHELTHTKHRNHSKAYYADLLAIMPDNKKRLRWLRDNGHRLTSEASGTLRYTDEIKTEIETKEMPSIEGM